MPKAGFQGPSSEPLKLLANHISDSVLLGMAPAQ